MGFPHKNASGVLERVLGWITLDWVPFLYYWVLITWVIFLTSVRESFCKEYLVLYTLNVLIYPDSHATYNIYKPGGCSRHYCQTGWGQAEGKSGGPDGQAMTNNHACAVNKTGTIELIHPLFCLRRSCIFAGFNLDNRARLLVHIYPVNPFLKVSGSLCKLFDRGIGM